MSNQVKGGNKGSVNNKGNTINDPKDEKAVKELFEVMDKDKSGLLSEKELLMGLRCMLGLNPTKTDIEQIFDEMGVKHGEEINFTKFRGCMLCYVKRSREKGIDREAEAESLKKAFERLDKNKTGFLTKGQFKSLFDTYGEKYTEKEMDDLFKEADTSNDGKLEIHEFIKIFLRDAK